MSTRRNARLWAWRVTAVVVLVLAGGLFITSGLNSKGLDLRAGSITDLGSVVRQERSRADGLQDQVADLNRQVTELTQKVDDTDVARLQSKVGALRGPAGYDAVRGPGVTVTLTDAPKSQIDKIIKEHGELGSNALVVHQQDIQAVANALWAGGAEAMTVQKQRVVSTTGIKCVGNTVVLHGVPYSPPYVISAIGDPDTLLTSLADNDYIDAYKTFVDTYQLGYDVQSSESLKMPAYDGALDLSYARPGALTAQRGN